MWSGKGELVGRADELTEIGGALRDRAGLHLVVLEGAPGIGKTRLLNEAASAARDSGAKVLFGPRHRTRARAPVWGDTPFFTISGVSVTR